MRLKELIESLDEERQYRIALDLAERALPIWDDYVKSNKLEYRDTVVGLHHTVKKDILARTLETIKRELANPKTQNVQIDKLREEFSDPIVAMQDVDWELPYPVEKTFYALYNLLNKLGGKATRAFDEPLIYIAINQEIDALETATILTEAEVKELLNEYRNGI